MPRAADILDGLSAIASQATSVAVAWHILIGTALLALLSGFGIRLTTKGVDFGGQAAEPLLNFAHSSGGFVVCSPRPFQT